MSAPAHSNATLLRKLVVVAAVMFGFGWAMVPLYRKICEVSGINLLTGRDPGSEARLLNTQVDTTREVVIEFDANRQGPWRFKPRVNHLTVHPGELVTIEYELVNLQDRAMAGQAIPSYAPMQASRYFNKVECFCFKQQTLQGGEARKFPVVFFVDPQLPQDVTQITLSYTFFEIPGAAGKSQAQVPAAPRS
ncbi:MAG TPA: cytochrome c oxidase assembly protein [Burkholderiaceae bacterium]|nr:cytochrome c oxidase assembly protein [Burkholderiaceae bacterium]